MLPRHINKADCASLLVEHGRLEGFLGLEVDWFVNETKDVVGIIGMGGTDQSWRLAVLTRQLRGSFRLRDLRCDGLYSFIAARAELLRNMVRLGGIGRRTNVRVVLASRNGA
jgi:hypothetical protein